MTAKEWFEVIKQSEDYNPAMTPLIEKYGEMLLNEQKDRSYSKEEVVNIAMDFLVYWRDGHTIPSDEEFKKWLAETYPDKTVKTKSKKEKCDHDFDDYQDKSICKKCGHTIYGDTGER